MKTEKYIEQIKRLPTSGRQVIAQREDDNMIVYQAFNPAIATYAIVNQKFGGDHYSFNRMSWIKPGFLWMMHRAGWAQKENQERILAITISISCFKEILKQATISSFDSELFATKQDWVAELEQTEVRLQWDPDHDPFGKKQERKAIQIGMKGLMLKRFCTEYILKIEDITDFAKSECQKVKSRNVEELIVPYEEVLELNDDVIDQRIGITKTK
ncbi:DUF4291 domain-containing protein [Lacibacter sediminis]|uniref:DUF4291 domain-containing protein n=1 Tax=Lacibacter sediminis TaxID=2760713 RepID=A0A7G5XFT6_9BACT|nr:DUF4291 domain-containing protein [Lacibacter sediminis]QNA44339.1 DUF4291 domain-containing protein [Lacibacter sediminis]